MPWNVKQVDNQYCVFDKNGKKMKCYADEAKAVQYKEALYANASHMMERATASMLEDGGPVVVGVAVTNIPHLPLPPMSIIEKDGNKFVRVPFLRKGIFSHPEVPNGKLVFDDQTFNTLLDNHDKRVSQWGVMLNERHDQGVSLAWFDELGGGWIQKENDPDFGDLLVGYGKPTGDTILDLVQNQKYRYASVEFRPKYKSSMLAKLSSDGLAELQLEDLVDIKTLEETMEEVTIPKAEYETLKGNVEKVTQLEAQLADGQAKIVTLEAKVATIPAPEKEKEYPEELRLELQKNREEIARLKKNALETQVSLVITKAESYRDKNGYGHSPVMLEIARAAMLGQEVKEGTIKLESAQPSDIADYFRKVMVHMLETVPGQVRMEGRTQGDDEQSINFERGETFTAEELAGFWTEAM